MRGVNCLLWYAFYCLVCATNCMRWYDPLQLEGLLQELRQGGHARVQDSDVLQIPTMSYAQGFAVLMSLAKAKIGPERVQTICNTLVAHFFNIPESPEDFRPGSVVLQALKLLDCHRFAQPRNVPHSVCHQMLRSWQNTRPFSNMR